MFYPSGLNINIVGCTSNIYPVAFRGHFLVDSYMFILYNHCMYSTFKLGCVLCVLQDNSQYRVQSEVRGQLRVLETIDRLIDKRKTERENEQTLKAAKSRSKGADPVKAAEIREVARQVSLLYCSLFFIVSSLLYVYVYVMYYTC